jgi:hypothetical protein
MSAARRITEHIDCRLTLATSPRQRHASSERNINMPLRRTIPNSLVLVPLVLCTFAVELAHAQPAPAPPNAPAAPAAAPAPEPPRAAPAAPSPAPVTPEPSPAPVPESPAPVPEASVPAPAPAAGADVAALRAELDETKQKLDQIQQRQDEAELAALGSAETEAPSEDLLKIYGFADMGVQHQWTKEGTLLSNIFATNATSFVIGNVNLYFDAQPIHGWRSLIEVRLTNAPQGDTISYGGLAGTYTREDTFSFDPHGTAINAPMWAGSIVLERAWIEWNDNQLFKVRTGNWFTPFGIWNEDHGSPTLISIALPQFILQQWIPIRQTGLMAYGNTFAGEWELGYALTFSNGRQELSNFNFEDKFGYGGRAYVRRDTGSLNTTFGLSYFTGTTSDQEINVVGINPVTFAKPTTWEYNEHVFGADLSIDIDATRIRAEGMVRRQTYTSGLRPAGDPIFSPGSVVGDRWQYSTYLLVAHQLPWLGLEPYLWAELLEGPSVLADGVFVGSLGLNIHFNPAVQLKTQFGRGIFFDWLYENPADASDDNLTQIYSRLVMAF